MEKLCLCYQMAKIRMSQIPLEPMSWRERSREIAVSFDDASDSENFGLLYQEMLDLSDAYNVESLCVKFPSSACQTYSIIYVGMSRSSNEERLGRVGADQGDCYWSAVRRLYIFGNYRKHISLIN